MNERKRRWLRRGIELVLFLVLIVAIRTWQQRDVVSGPAPPLTGILLDGTPYSLTEQLAERRGEAVLVHFWATWCPVCALEERSIDAIAETHPVITVAMQSGEVAEVTAHLMENGLDFPVLNDPEGHHASRWGVRAVPTSFVVAPDGVIRFTEVGYTTGIGLRVRLWLAGR